MKVTFSNLMACVAPMLFYTCTFQTKSTSEIEEAQFRFDESTLSHIEKLFVENDLKGCFILHDLQKDTSFVYNQERADKEFLPASTFKIANSLISLECKAVKSVHEVIPWDSVERSYAAWNTDQTMQTAFKYSAVWFYQELARRVGADQMQSWVSKMQYGNHTIGPNIDDFWLVGDIRITPLQQVDFLKKVISEDLPFKKKHINSLKDIMIEDRKEHYIMRGKSGWATKGTPVGWYVGYLEVSGSTYIFVLNMDVLKEGDQKYRKVITKEILDGLFMLDLAI